MKAKVCDKSFDNMDQYRFRRSTKAMSGLGLLGVGCSSLLYYQPALTGTGNVAGIIGGVVGFYICSHPAAHIAIWFEQTSSRSVPHG